MAIRRGRTFLLGAMARVGRLAWVVLAVALILRVALVLATFDTPTTLDPADFSRTALSIAQGHGYPSSNRAPDDGPSAFRPPAYPAFLAAIYAVAGQEAPPAGRIAGAVLGTVAVGLIGLIAARLWGRRVGMLALGIGAVAPPLIVLSTTLVSEVLFVPLMLAAVLCALEARRSPHPLRWALATGLVLGVAELTRTNALVLVPPLAFAVWSASRRPAARRRWQLRPLLAPAVLIAAAVLTVAPWTIRNWLVLHAFVPVSTEIGYTVAGTYNQASRADQHWPAVWKEAEHGASPEYGQILFYASTERWSEKELGDRLQSAALADIRRDPLFMLKVGMWNAIRMFHLGELDFGVANLRDTDVPHLPALLEIYGFYPLGVLALIGLATSRVRRAPRWLWVMPLCLALTIFVTGFIRFRAPIDPFLVMLAALGTAWLLERRPRRSVSSDRREPVAPSSDERERAAAGSATFSRARCGVTLAPA
jgi:4-amino-4-deoxy-L-arabinose transferase-like glycosyltransferase